MGPLTWVDVVWLGNSHQLFDSIMLAFTFSGKCLPIAPARDKNAPVLVFLLTWSFHIDNLAILIEAGKIP